MAEPVAWARSFCFPVRLDDDPFSTISRASKPPDGGLADRLICPECRPSKVIKYGRDDFRPQHQGYRFHGCVQQSDDLGGRVFAGHHQSLSDRVKSLDFSTSWCLNRSIDRIARELSIEPDDDQGMIFSSVRVLSGASPGERGRVR